MGCSHGLLRRSNLYLSDRPEQVVLYHTEMMQWLSG